MMAVLGLRWPEFPRQQALVCIHGRRGGALALTPPGEQDMLDTLVYRAACFSGRDGALSPSSSVASLVIDRSDAVVFRILELCVRPPLSLRYPLLHT